MAGEFDDGGGLPLSVTVAADEWAFVRRRVRYLEAVIIQVLRDKNRLREWYGAAELAALVLPGLPRSRQGIGKLAAAQNWRRRMERGRFEYHCASLPGRAFDGLLQRIIGTPDELADDGIAPLPAPVVPAPPAPVKAPIAANTNTAPVWVLPLLRVLKANPGELEQAVAELPERLPAGVECPTIGEVRATLERLGIAV